jgi:hypothetical protein
MIQLEAWNLRERDDWGKTARLRRAGREPERWHWVYTGTCFRLDHRGQTCGRAARDHGTRLRGHAARSGRLARTTPRGGLGAWAGTSGRCTGDWRRGRVAVASGRRPLGPKPASSWTLTTPCNPWRRWAERSLARSRRSQKPGCGRGSGNSSTNRPSKWCGNWRRCWRDCRLGRRLKPWPGKQMTFTNIRSGWTIGPRCGPHRYPCHGSADETD